jgi:hypothetical protein
MQDVAGITEAGFAALGKCANMDTLLLNSCCMFEIKSFLILQQLPKKE